MKRCPTCNKTYTDDSMSFCLEDGAPLLSVGGDQPPAGSGSFDPNLTIPFTPPRDTSEQGTGAGAPGSQWGAPSGGPASGQFGQPGGYGQQGGQYGQQGQSGYGGPASGQFPPPPQQPSQYPPAPSWGGPQPPPPYAAAPKKSSALPWVLGGLGVLVVLGIAAAVLVGVLASMSSNTNKNNSNNSNQVSNKTNRNGSSNNSNNSNSSNSNNTNSTTTGKPAASDDFSTEAWWTGSVNVGSAEYTNDEYHLRATPTGYMVIYGPDAFRTENATTRVTARSVSSSPERGFGLAVFGEMSKKKELEDYSFLIRTSGTPAYKIVMHRGGNETTIVDWTDASQIRSGTSPNQLEVRTSGTQAAFYINGQYVTTIEAQSGYAVGLAGFYTSGTEEVAFDDLQIFK
ncbi:MAG: hypothetical protein ICV60_21700 [Pyrinomonadaceae bacterium]|nr:hypothetical protein [Pyrinomonadaceae bacterium]